MVFAVFALDEGFVPKVTIFQDALIHLRTSQAEEAAASRIIGDRAMPTRTCRKE